MTNEERKVIELALEWIEKQPEEITASKYDVNSRYVVLRELEAALAQPEQEPVAYCWKSLSTGDLFDFVENKNGDALKEQDEDFPTSNLILLYTTPPQRKPLTDEQIEELWESTASYYNVCDFARAIEAAHGIKG